MGNFMVSDPTETLKKKGNYFFAHFVHNARTVVYNRSFL